MNEGGGSGAVKYLASWKDHEILLSVNMSPPNHHSPQPHANCNYWPFLMTIAMCECNVLEPVYLALLFLIVFSFNSWSKTFVLIINNDCIWFHSNEKWLIVCSMINGQHPVKWQWTVIEHIIDISQIRSHPITIMKYEYTHEHYSNGMSKNDNVFTSVCNTLWG